MTQIQSKNKNSGKLFHQYYSVVPIKTVNGPIKITKKYNP